MLGTVPKDKEIYRTYIEAKKAERAELIVAGTRAGGGPKNLPDDVEADTVPQVDESRGWTGFHENENGLFLYDYAVKGALKEAGNVLKDQIGIKALRSKIDNYVFVFPRKVYILDEETNEAIKKPDGIFERPLRAQTMQGPRVSLVRSDQVNAGRKLRFEIRAIEDSPIPKLEEVLRQCMEYWELKGLGQFRNGSFGRCTFEMLEQKDAHK